MHRKEDAKKVAEEMKNNNRGCNLTIEKILPDGSIMYTTNTGIGVEHSVEAMRDIIVRKFLGKK